MWAHSKRQEPGSGLSPDAEYASALSLDFPASWTIVYKPPQSVVFSYGSPNGWRQPPFHMVSLKNHCLSRNFLYVKAFSNCRLPHLPDQWMHFSLSWEKRQRQELLKLIACCHAEKTYSCLTEIPTHPSSSEMEPKSYFPKLTTEIFTKVTCKGADLSTCWNRWWRPLSPTSHFIGEKTRHREVKCALFQVMHLVSGGQA